MRLSTVEGEELAESEGVFANFSRLAEVSARFEFGSGRSEGNVYLRCLLCGFPGRSTI